MSVTKKQRSIPKVSVLCITYNHVNFIKECLDSLLSQKTDFTYEILINDDCSNDGTKEIIEEYQRKHPTIVKPVFHKQNQYSQGKRNFMVRHLIPVAEGQYFAVCEGDDFWTDVNKLQKQVEFLENNPNHSVCFHPVRAFFQDDSHEDYVYPQQRSGFTTKKLLQGNFIQTNSVMYRRAPSYEDVDLDVMPGDWYLHLYHAQFGKIGFINSVMSAYRLHRGGLWWDSREKSDEIWKAHGDRYVKLYTKLLDYYGSSRTYRKIIRSNLEHVYSRLIDIDSKQSTDYTRKVIVSNTDATKELIEYYRSQLRDYTKELEKLRLDRDAVAGHNKNLKIRLPNKTTPRGVR
jgi:glycosyltransferase involved in cell wall biosynthesis